MEYQSGTNTICDTPRRYKNAAAYVSKIRREIIDIPGPEAITCCHTPVHGQWPPIDMGGECRMIGMAV